MMTVIPQDYEAMLQQFYEKVLYRGACCIDVGAHTGRHTIPMSRCVGPEGTVHAFEPLPNAAAELRRRIVDLDPKAHGTVTVHQAALARQSGRSTFVSVPEAPEYSGLRVRLYDRPVSVEEIEVDLHKLDDHAESICDVAYVKIDVEGAELEVLAGGLSILKRDRPLISFEFGDNSIVAYPYNSQDMYRFLAGLGYCVMTITAEELDEASFVASARRQGLWDYVACPASKRDVLDDWLSSTMPGKRSDCGISPSAGSRRAA